MTCLVFIVALVILEIIMFVKFIKNFDKESWHKLLITFLAAIASALLFIAYSWISADYLAWDFLVYLILQIVLIIVTFFFSIISLTIKNKKIDEYQDKSNLSKHKVFLFLILIFTATITAIAITDLPYRIKNIQDSIQEKNAKLNIVITLGDLYGKDGNFKVQKIEDINLCKDCFWGLPYQEGYKFTISSTYLENSFNMIATKKDLKITENNFLKEYYKEKYNTDDISKYIKDIRIKEFNDIFKDFNLNISFEYVNLNLNSHNTSKQIPEIDELKLLVEFENPKIVIDEDISSKEELLEYLKHFLKFYINNTDDFNIKYNGDKFIKFKLNKNNNDYVGYIYLNEQTSKVSIHIDDNIYEYNLKEILK